MNKNKEIKGIRIVAVHYRETSRGLAYTAPLLLDGKEIGIIENGGYGGVTMIRVYGSKREELLKRINAYFEEHDDEIPEDLREERFAECLLDMHEFGKVLTDEERLQLLSE